jgi:hypothetical protein
MQADIQHIRAEQNRINYRFGIIELGSQTPKVDRIKRLIPIFEQGRMFLPSTLWRTDYEGKTVDLVHAFIEEEYIPFPVPVHDDMLDCLARIVDPDFPTSFPSTTRSRVQVENCSNYDAFA